MGIETNQRNVSVTANTNILASNVSPTNPYGWAVITVIPTVAGKLSIVHHDGTNSDIGIANNDTDLAAGGEYTFEVPVPPNESINIRYSVNDTFKKLIIVEG
jgi:hypothetical protein